jgi:hypothetical protein
LLYDPTDPDLTDLIRPERLESAVGYLTAMDKLHFSLEKIVKIA